MKNIFFSLLMLANIAAWSQCQLIAKWGIYDTRYLSISRDRAISFLNFFKRDTRMTFEEAKEYSTTIGIPIETVMVNLGFSLTESSYKNFVETVSRMTTYDEIFIEKITEVSRTINKDIVKVLEQCYSSNGIHARIENTTEENISFLVLKFNWEGNHDPVPIQLNISDRTGMKLDGQQLTSSSKNYTINPDEELRIAIERNTSRSYAFTVRVKRQVPGGTVLVRDPGLVLFKDRTIPATVSRELKVEKVPVKQLPQTSQARWTGGGDEELKRFETTELAGSFYLGINGRKLTGNIFATIKEVISDFTSFEIRTSYDLYEAPEGWRIVGYGISTEPYGSSVTNFGPLRQGNWESYPLYTEGPLAFYTWQGDSGSKQDQLEGCWIRCTLKDIVVLLEKE